MLNERMSFSIAEARRRVSSRLKAAEPSGEAEPDISKRRPGRLSHPRRKSVRESIDRALSAKLLSIPADARLKYIFLVKLGAKTLSATQVAESE